ncbi:MAG: signal peptidase II [Limnochordaceae bacterium]|nr:signal peptidase II [Limnochordaceae bacterium]
MDRLRTGSVIDFIDLSVWPVFNLADTGIVVGVALALLVPRPAPRPGGLRRGRQPLPIVSGDARRPGSASRP